MRRPLAALAALAALAGAARAEAYCRSSACAPRDDGSTDGHVCLPAQNDDCGVALQWRQPCVGFAVHAEGSSQVDVGTATALLTQAFATWTAVDCGDGPPSIQVFDLGQVSCARLEYNQHAGNANVLLFRDDAWPHEGEASGTADTLALTTVTYDVEKGDIYDADIEVNTAGNHFVTTAEVGPDEIDLLSVLTHEVGHFLGLAHTPVEQTTMYPDYTLGSTALRDLADDDRAAICDAYPRGRDAQGACTGLPRHGFASECSEEQTWVKCATGPGAKGSGAATAAAMALALAAIRARRGSRRSSRTR